MSQVQKKETQETSSSNQLQAGLTPVHVYIGNNAGTLVKLATFSAALFAFPIVTFFLTLHSWFDGDTTYAAGAAAVMANLIVAAYIITAMFEKPREEKKEAGEEKKKDQ